MADVLSKKKEQDVILLTTKLIAEGASHCTEKHTRSEENQTYTRGAQWSKGDIARQQLRDRPTSVWNSIFKIVQAIANREIVDRFVPKVFGREDSDNGVANVLDEACRWQRDFASSEQMESMAARSAAMSGYGWMHKYWDPAANDGEGMIVDEDVPVWEMLWPSRARQINLNDKRWVVRGKWMDIGQAESLYGQSSRKARNAFKRMRGDLPYIGSAGSIIEGAPNADSSTSPYTSSASGMGWQTIVQGNWVNKASKEVFVVEAEWIESETVWKAAIPVRFLEWEAFILSGTPLNVDGQQTITLPEYQQADLQAQQGLQMQILEETNEETFQDRVELDDFIERYYQVTGREFEDFDSTVRNRVMFAIRINDMILDYGMRPWGFSYHAITCFPFETRDGMDFFGVVDIAKGPQDYKNALLSNMLAMYMSSPKGAMLVEKGALPGMDSVADKMSSPSAVVEVPDGFLSQKRYEFMQAPNFPSSGNELLGISTSGVEESFGLSSLDLGSQSDLRRVSGTVAQYAKTAGNTIIAIYFDSIRMHRKKYGLCNAKFMKTMYTLQQIIRIIGRDKVKDLEGLPESWDDVFRFDVVIDEVPVSATEKQETLDFLTRTGLLGDWISAGYISFENALNMMQSIPESEKRKILEGKTQQEQLQNMQQELEKNKMLTSGLIQTLMKEVPNSQPIMAQFLQNFQMQQLLQEQSSTQPAQ